MLKQSSTLNEIEIQAVKIVSEPPWHLWQAGILTLIHARGERMLACYDEPVVVVREFWKMTRSQQEALRSEGINRHEWERSPLGAHAALFMHRAREIGRLSAFVKKYYDYDDRTAFQQQISENPRVGWMRDIPLPYQLQDEKHHRNCREGSTFRVACGLSILA